MMILIKYNNISSYKHFENNESVQSKTRNWKSESSRKVMEILYGVIKGMQTKI